MITKDEALEIITELNEDAHARAYDTWLEADALGDSDDEEDWARAEEIREDASYEQAGYFRADFHNLPQDEQDSIWQYALEDDDFAEDFKAWYGHEAYEEKLEDTEK